MKKFFKLSFITILLLALFASCVQDDETVFKSIVHSNPKSKYSCSKYIGYYGGSHYVLTKNNGIISFELSTASSASNIQELSTGSYKAVDSATIIDNILYGLNGFGELFYIDLSKEAKTVNTIEGNYCLLSDKYVVTTANGTLCDLSTTPTATAVTGISKVVSRNYFKNASGLYLNGVIIQNTDQDIVNVIKVDSETYYAINTGSSYAVYNSSLSLIATLSDEPTASFYMGEGKIAYKTASSIEIVDTVNKTVTEKTNGWATNLYTDTSKISEFVTIDSNIYSLNGSGGMMLIDYANETATQIFSK